jgi:hypothetical protein
LAALSSFKDLELELISQLFNTKPFVMKTILNFICLIIITGTMNAQVANTPFEIQNNTNCNLPYSYKVFDDQNCGSCQVVSSQTVNLSSSNFIYSFNGSCSNANQACNLQITLNLPGYGNLVVDNTWYSSSPVSGPFGSCISTTGSISWSNNILTINP